MIRLAPTIREDGINTEPQKQRETVRAIITNDKHEVYMLYSSRFNDYTFPGGGMKLGETRIDALKRELKEELGVKTLINIRAFGKIDEIKYGLFKNTSTYLQTSYYYFCDIKDFGDKALEDHELLDDLKPVFIHIDEAIKHNEVTSKDENHQAYGLKTVLIRENTILKKLKEFNHEKI